jgi:hypothetical protein
MSITQIALANVATHWPREWQVSAYGDVDFYTASDDVAPFNTGTANSEIGFARNTWNSVSDAPVLVDYGGTLAMSDIACGDTGLDSVPLGRVYVKGCPRSTPGWAYSSVVMGTNLIARSLILMDSSPVGYVWHISSDASVALGARDLRGAVAHEVGHALGASHINIGDCNTTSAQTMCSTHSNGSSKYRTSQPHEQADFKGQY